MLQIDMVKSKKHKNLPKAKKKKRKKKVLLTGVKQNILK